VRACVRACVCVCVFSVHICVGACVSACAFARGDELRYQMLSKYVGYSQPKKVLGICKALPLFGCVAVCCSVLQRGSAWFSVVQRGAVCCSVLQWLVRIGGRVLME